MAVLAEALSVIVRVDVIEDSIPGGMAGYRTMVPNRTFCTDGRIARVGFHAPPDVGAFCEHLRQFGIRLRDDDGFVDIAVIDQREGPTLPCAWLRFERHAEGYSSVRLVNEASAHPLSAPEGWTPAQSSSLRFSPNEELDERFIGMDRADGMETLLDTRTGRFLYMGRAAVSEEFTVSPSPRAFPVIVRRDTFDVWWVDKVNAWPRLSRVLEPAADVYLPFFNTPTSNADAQRLSLTPRALALGILTSDQPPSSCPTALNDAQATAALHFVARVMGTKPDENMSSAAAFLSQAHGEAWAIRALRRACVLFPDSVFSRGDLVVRLFELAREDKAHRAELLRETAEAFLPIAPGSTEQSKNEEYVLMRGLTALWYAGGEDIARKALMRHRARVDAYADVRRELREHGLPI